MKRNVLLGLMLCAVLLFAGLGVVVVCSDPAAVAAAFGQSRVQMLIGQLDDRHSVENRAKAARALGELGAAARPAAPALVKAMRDDGRYVTYLLLFPQELNLADDASQALLKIRGPETVDAIVASLTATHQAVRRGEAEWDYNRDRRLIEVLAAMGTEALPAAGPLLSILEDCMQGSVVEAAIFALAEMQLPSDSPEAAKARQVLPQHLTSSVTAGRAAATILLRLSPDDEQAAADYVRVMLAGEGGLGAIDLDEQTLPLVIEHLADQPNQAAVSQLSVGDAVIAMQPLCNALASSHPRIRAGAAQVLGNRETAAKEAAPQLLPLLGDENLAVRAAAGIALWRIDQQASAVLPALAAGLAGDDAAARELVEAFVQQRGPGDAWAVEALTACLVPERPVAERIVAARILERIGPAASAAMPALLELLKDNDSTIQRAAAAAVTAVGR